MKTNPEARETMHANEMRAEYDLKGGQRNPYADRMRKGTNIVLIDPELYPYFPDSESVNAALHLLVQAGKKAVAMSAEASDARAVDSPEERKAS